MRTEYNLDNGMKYYAMILPIDLYNAYIIALHHIETLKENDDDD